MNNIPVTSPIKRITIGQKEIILIGTAHVSAQSAKDVDSLIRAENPSCVAIELCAGRLDAISNPEVWKNTDIFSVIKQGKTLVLLTQLTLSAYQKRIADKLGIEPGAEMKVALKTAKELNIPISVIDRDIKITLRRTWSNLSFWAFAKILFSSIFSYKSAEELSESEIERLKEQDELTAAVEEFAKELPQIKESLIDERDYYMAAKLLEMKDGKIIAVLGAGHLEGMFKYLEAGSPLAYDHLNIIPPPSKLSKILTYALPVSIVAFFIYGFVFIDPEEAMKLLGTWAIATGIGASLGALCALAHPLSIISAGLAAPIAAIHPGIATGWVSGLVEAWVRSPKVSDFENISSDLQSISGFWKNRVMRILLVGCFSNIGCLVGMTFGSLTLIKMLN